MTDDLLRQPDGAIDWQAMRERLVAHLVSLYYHPDAGPDYARASVKTILAMPSCPYLGLGQDVKNAIDQQEARTCKTS